MSRRKSIVNALAESFKAIDGTGNFTTNIFDNSYPKLKFWDEVQDFPSIYVTAGPETREYLPSDFTWGYVNVSVKLYTKGEEPLDLLEDLLEDAESVIHSLNGVIVYGAGGNERTTDINITSIVTDEGLLRPYGVGEISLLVRYMIIR